MVYELDGIQMVQKQENSRSMYNMYVWIAESIKERPLQASEVNIRFQCVPSPWICVLDVSIFRSVWCGLSIKTILSLDRISGSVVWSRFYSLYYVFTRNLTFYLLRMTISGHLKYLERFTSQWTIDSTYAQFGNHPLYFYGFAFAVARVA